MTRKANVTMFQRAQQEAVAKQESKAVLIASAKTKIGDAAKLYATSQGKSREADDLANDGALSLYKAQSAGLATREETSSILGSIFGFKEKKDGSASKTPNGQGEVIRKRVLRAVDAASYAFDETGKVAAPSYLDGVNRDDVKAEITRLDANDPATRVSIFTLYDTLGKMRERTPLPQWFDAAKILKLAGGMAADGVPERIAQSPTLIEAYKALAVAMAMVDDAISADVEEEKVAA